MLNRIKPKILESNTANDFAQKIVNLFSGFESANLQDYLYSSPRHDGDKVNGAHLLNKMYKECDAYYLQKAEKELVQSAANSIACEVGNSPTFIDYGPGPVESIANKTLPILSKLTAPKFYIPVDLCEEYTKHAAQYIASIYPGLKINPICFDYYDRMLGFRRYQNPVIYFSGSSMFNCPGKTKVEFNAHLLQRLEILSKQLGPGGKLLITHDSNQNEQSLMNAYKNIANEAFILNILHRIKRDALDQFDPSKFTHYVEVDKKNTAVKIGVEAVDHQSIMIGTKQLRIEKGHRYAITNSLKYAANEFTNLCISAGFSSIKSWSNSGNPMVIHLLKVSD